MAWRLGVSGREGCPCGWQQPDGGKSLQCGDSHLSQQLGCSKAKSSRRACVCADTPPPPGSSPYPLATC